MSLNIHSLYSRIFKVWRQQRFQAFVRTLQPARSDRVLDVGGGPGTWTDHPPVVKSIDSLNVYDLDWDPANAPDHQIATMIGDGCALQFPDRSYDIGFSNSVIEHVGSWERQKRFAAEIRRVANALWVQTPAHECPIEPHYLAPFIHYFPRALQKKLVRWCSLRGWLDNITQEQAAAMVDEIRLLTKSEMQELFPDCEIMTERLLWFLPKSYIAVRRRAGTPGSATPDRSS